jgi:hypothetical protein
MRRDWIAQEMRFITSLAGATQRDLISSETIREDVGFEVLTVVAMKSTLFWNVMPCSTLEIH